MKEKKINILIILGCLLLISLTVSMAYFMTKIEGEGKVLSVSSKELKVIFTQNNTISSSNIEPGWSNTISFTVKNEQDTTYKYNISITDLINTFVTSGNLVYKITSNDGGYNMSEFKDIPKSSAGADKVLAYSVEINANTTHSYSIEFKYINSTEDQSDDMGKVLSGTLIIEEGTIDHGDYEEGTLGWQLLDDNQTRSARTSFSAVFTSTTTGTLYTATESIAGSTAKTVYYYAGNTTNNWVKFGGFYWRIIRTNADGSVRLLYSGTESQGTTGTAAYIGTSVFNGGYGDPMSVGYMYGTSGELSTNRANSNSSTIKRAIDKWYASNLSSYTSYLSTTAVYCNDRKAPNYSTSSFSYYVSTRLSAGNPTYDCEDSKDAFSASNTDAKLTYPIGLMTADEITYAGGYKYKSLSSPYAWYYLNSSGSSITGSTWWRLLSPSDWNGYFAYVWNVGGSGSPGYLGGNSVGNAVGVRPTISLKACALVSSGNGTSESPYVINTSTGC